MVQDHGLPVIFAMDRARPTGTGAMKLSLDLSAASMRMFKTSCAVLTISMKSSCEADAPGAGG